MVSYPAHIWSNTVPSFNIEHSTYLVQCAIFPRFLPDFVACNVWHPLIDLVTIEESKVGLELKKSISYISCFQSYFLLHVLYYGNLDNWDLLQFWKKKLLWIKSHYFHLEYSHLDIVFKLKNISWNAWIANLNWRVATHEN